MLPCTATGARSTHWKVMRRMGTRVVCSQRACTLPHKRQNNAEPNSMWAAAAGAQPQLVILHGGFVWVRVLGENPPTP